MSSGLVRRLSQSTIIAFAVGFLVATITPAAIAAPGDLDPSFGSGGTLTTAIGSSSDVAQGVAVQPDGKIVTAGYSVIGSSTDVALARYTSTGALDPTFGSGGKVTTPIGSGNDYGTAVAIQPDGKIVAAGQTFNGSNSDFALVRYTSSGSLDFTFNGTGKVTTPIGSFDDVAYGVAIQTDGKIVAAGYRDTGLTFDFALARYTSTGTLDSSFGTGGKVTTDIGAVSIAYAMAIQTDGKVVAAGYSYNGSNTDVALARYTTTGALDPTFGTGGTVTTPIGSSTDVAQSVAIQTDGKIVTAGYSVVGSTNDFALVRYTTTGALDTTFNGTGKVTTPIGSSSDVAYGTAIQADGKILAAGFSDNGSNLDFALARYTATGALDSSFGTGGKVTTGIGAGDDFALAIAIQPDGKIVTAGDSIFGLSNDDFALARYLTEPPTISISDASATEGDAGTTNMTFTVSVALPGTRASGDITVNYSTADGSATAPADYTAKSGSLTFFPGQTSKTIAVAVKGDLSDEQDEAFFVHLSNPQGAVIGNGTATGTILDNDPAPGMYVSDVTVTEGNSGTTGATFILSLSNPSSQAVSVDYATDDGTATAPGDYQAKSGTKVFLPGQTTKTVTVFVKGETVQEPNETFFLNLADPDNAVLVDGQGMGTITDDDRPVININDASVTEANGTTTKTMTFTVSLTHAGTSTVTVHYATVNGTATAPGDYTAKSGTVTFSVDTVSKTIAITIKGDNLVEGNETFTVELDTPTNATIGDGTGVGLIVDND